MLNGFSDIMVNGFSDIMVHSYITYAFTSTSKFNIASMVT